MRSVHLVRMAMGVAVAAQLFVLYLPGSPEISQIAIPGLDKIIHFGIFAAPAFLARQLTAKWWPIMLLAFHVPLSEWIQQQWIAYRGAEWLDAAADFVGIAAGVLLAWLLARYRAHRVSNPR